MKKVWKRVIAMLLVVVIIGGASPLLTAGAEDGYKVGDIIEFGSYPQT